MKETNWTRTTSSSRGYFGHSNHALMVSNFASRWSKLMKLSCMGNIEERYWSQLRKMVRTTYYQLPSPS